MIDPIIHRLIASLQRINPLARTWTVRESELMKGRVGRGHPGGSLLHEKPRYKGDWFRLETRWMGGEMDCKDV